MAAFHLTEFGLLAAQPDLMIGWLGASNAALIPAECGRYASFRQGHSARAIRRDLTDEAYRHEKAENPDVLRDSELHQLDELLPVARSTFSAIVTTTCRFWSKATGSFGSGSSANTGPSSPTQRPGLVLRGRMSGLRGRIQGSGPHIRDHPVIRPGVPGQP